MSSRFYCPDPPQNGLFLLQDDEAKHLARVSRHEVGDTVELFDGKGFATHARVTKIGKNEVELIAEGPPIPEIGSACRLTLATAIPKGDRFDWLVEKATELGVSRLIPLITERSVVEPRDSKLDRLRRAVIEASKQSKRNRLMAIEPPLSLGDLLSGHQTGIRLLAQPDGAPAWRWPSLRGCEEVALAVGPEGGFTMEEVNRAIEAGWSSIQFGGPILRVETAGLAGASRVLGRYLEQNGGEDRP